MTLRGEGSARSGILRVGSGPNRLLRAGLLAVVGLISIRTAIQLLDAVPFGVDLDIPLRATDRWLHGDQPYLASSFLVPAGRDLPFLYPPFLLPLLSPLLLIPRGLALAGWALACVGVSLAALRRLGVPSWGWSVVLLGWPPFLEGILATNIQIVLAAAFIFLFWERAADWRPGARPDVGARWADPALAVLIGAIKASQVHAWIACFRYHPRRALIVGAISAALIGLTVLLTGTDLWRDWLGQAARASDPGWPAIGTPVSTFLGGPVALAVAGVSIVLAFLVRPVAPGLWIGPLILLASPTIQPFAWLFLLPGMLLVRREIGLLAAILLAAHSAPAAWAAFVIVVGAQIVVALDAARGSALLEPVRPADSAPLGEPA